MNSLEFTRRRLLDLDAGSAPPQVADFEGFSILARADDLAVGHAVLSGRYEPEVVAVFRDELRPGMSVIDVGANIGVFTMLAATLVGGTGSVLAIEPNPRNARMAEASRRLNGFEHVVVVQAAAGRTAGMLAINTSFSNGTTSSLEADFSQSAETVACFAIDQLVASDRRVDLIKLDVEGAEYNALQGCETLLRRDRPVLVFEFGPGQLPGISGVTGEELLGWLVELGYGFEIIRTDGPPHAVGRDIPAVMQAYRQRGVDHIDLVARPEPPDRQGVLGRTLTWAEGAGRPGVTLTEIIIHRRFPSAACWVYA